MDNAKLKEIHDVFSEAITNSNKVMVKYAAVNGSKKRNIFWNHINALFIIIIGMFWLGMK
ncbi:MAG: hypothetical protein L6U99_02245 [Clostridium sp.]|nr:MAG: hypothetical protein L6U99_02245 [Clostridium sp.]